MRTSARDGRTHARPVAAEVSVEEATRSSGGERHGLFGKGGSRSGHVVRAHPLVRDFLKARLTRSIRLRFCDGSTCA